MERVAWDVAVGMAERGHPVKIITTARPDRAGPDAESHPGIEVEHLVRTRPGRYSREWWRMSREAYHRGKATFNPDIVFSVSAGAKAVVPLINDIPAVMQAHGTLLEEIRSNVRSGNVRSAVSAVHNCIKIPQDLLMYKRVRKVIAVGPFVYNSLLHPLCRLALSKQKVVMIPNSINTAQFRFDPSAGAALRKKLGIPGHNKVIVTVSRLHKQKGIHCALAALSRLPGDVWFLIAGDGPEMNNLKKRADELGVGNRVRFVGTIPHESLFQYLSAADAFVYTSLWNEGLPLGVLEAMAVNLPCVITRRLTAALDIPVDSPGIYGVDSEDAHMTATTIQRAVHSDACVTRSIVEKKYSQVHMLDRYEHILKELVTEYS